MVSIHTYTYMYVYIFKDVFIKSRNLCDLVELSAMRALPRDVSWRNKKATEIQNKNTYKMEIEVDKVDINVDVAIEK